MGLYKARKRDIFSDFNTRGRVHRIRALVEGVPCRDEPAVGVPLLLVSPAAVDPPSEWLPPLWECTDPQVGP